MWTRFFSRNTWALAGLILSLWLVPSSQAAAQGCAPEVCGEREREAEARVLFEAGRAHADEERWVEALDAFRRSRALVERPSILFNIATTLIRLGRAQEALATLAELEGIVANSSSREVILRDAQSIRAQAEASLRHVALRVTPADARIEIDGQPIVSTGTERTLTLDPGQHVVVVSLEGFAPARFTLEPSTDAREVSLAALDGVLHIVPSVEESEVMVNGTARGTGAMELALQAGHYALEIRAPGYLPYEREVEVHAGITLTVDATLEPIPHEEAIYESPIFWGVGAGVLVLAGVGIALGVVFGSTTLPVSGGSTNTTIAPLTIASF